MAKTDCFYVKLEEIAVHVYENASNFKLVEPRCSTEILSDLVRKDAAEFSDKFSHFQYATLQMFKMSLNDYSMLKLRFFNKHRHFCNVL